MQRHDVRFRVMGSDAHVIVLDGDPGLVDHARARLDELERRWSRFRPDSEIGQLSRSGGEPTIVSTETYDVVAAALEAWRWSDGRFDPTVGRTMELAGYDRPFTPDTVREAVTHHACPTPRGIGLDPYLRAVAVPAGVSLDLGGIGKGAAADLVATELLAAGAAGCCINVGGDVRVAGRPPRPEGWRVEIDHGIDDPGLTIGLVDGAVCTSTRARRTWTGPLGDEHHLRQPSTGGPVDNGLRAITVVGARALQAEVVAKTAFVAGPDAAPGIIAGVGATGALSIEGGRPTALDGLAPFLAAGADAGRAVGEPA